jgi:hypothetical protein
MKKDLPPSTHPSVEDMARLKSMLQQTVAPTAAALQG